MKSLIYSVIILWASLASASPFLVCDPQEGITEYKLVWDDGEIEYSNAINGAARHDMMSVKDGQMGGNLFAGRPWQVDGADQNTLEWSDPRPFVLTRPSKPSLPMNIGLSK